MNIEQLKTAIASDGKFPLPVLMLTQQVSEAGEPEPWASHWDNTNRVRVVMHMEVFAEIKADPAKTGFAFKKEVVAATDTRAAYTRYIIIKPRNVLGTF